MDRLRFVVVVLVIITGGAYFTNTIAKLSEQTQQALNQQTLAQINSQLRLISLSALINDQTQELLNDDWVYQKLLKAFAHQFLMIKNLSELIVDVNQESWFIVQKPLLIIHQPKNKPLRFYQIQAEYSDALSARQNQTILIDLRLQHLEPVQP